MNEGLKGSVVRGSRVEEGRIGKCVYALMRQIGTPFATDCWGKDYRSNKVNNYWLYF